jgi:hypothetical protein
VRSCAGGWKPPLQIGTSRSRRTALFREFTSACWFACKWGLLAALLAVAGVGLYYYSKLNDEIRQRVEAKFASHYRNLSVTLRSARLIDGQGIEIRGLSIQDPNIGGPQGELIYFDEIFLYCQTSLQDLIQHEPQITRMAVRRPRIQATRLPDGTWSVAKLFPLPKFSDRPPDMSVEGAQVIVLDTQRQVPATFNIKDINLSVTPAAGADGVQHSLCQIKGWLAADHVQRVEIVEGHYDKSTNVVDLRGTVTGVDICPELLAVLPGTLAERTEPVRPLRGRVDLGFAVRHDPAVSPTPQFDIQGQLSSARFDDDRLPQALANIRASFRANHRGVVIDEFTTNNGRAMKAKLSAKIDGYGPGAPIRIEGFAENLLIGPLWETLLPPKLREQWQKFLPAGELSVRDINVVYDGHRWYPQATVDCKNVSFSFYRFPYRLEHCQGPNALVFRHNRELGVNEVLLNIRGFAGLRPIKIEGAFQNPGPDFTGKVTVAGEDLPIDPKLFQAMDAAQPVPYTKARQIIESLHPIGTFNLWTCVERSDPRDPVVHKEMRISLNRGSLCYDKFRYPISNVEGQIQIIDNQWTFQNFKGTNDTGVITCTGDMVQAADGSGVKLHLQFKGEEIVLEDELRDAIPNAHARQLWNDMKPRGAIKLSADVNYLTGDQQPKITTTISPALESVSIHPSFFPYRIEQMRGEATFDFNNGHADFRNISGVHNRTQMSASGVCDSTPGGPWHVQFKDFSVDQVRLDQDPDLLTALPPPLRKAITQLNPRGLIGLRGTLDMWGEPCAIVDPNLPLDARPPCNVRIGWTDLEIDMQQGMLKTGVALNNVNGRVTLTGVFDPTKPAGQKLLCRGMLDVDSVSWNGFQFTKVSGPMWLDDSRVLLGTIAEPREANRLPRPISAQCYGGIVKTDAWVSLEETPRFSLQSYIAGGDLRQFCTEALPGRQNLHGKVTASINLNGNAAGINTLHGNGDIELNDADIYELPVLMSMLNVLKLRPPDTTAFTKSRVKFRVEGDHMLMDHIEFSGEVISLIGEGDMNLNTAIDLRLNSVLGRSDIQLPFLTALARTASGQIVEFHVTGTLARPEVHREAFPTVTKALQSVQLGMQPADRQTVPHSTRYPTIPAEPQRR